MTSVDKIEVEKMANNKWQDLKQKMVPLVIISLAGPRDEEDIKTIKTCIDYVLAKYLLEQVEEKELNKSFGG